MRKAWGKLYNKKRHIQLNKSVLHEAQMRANFMSEASQNVRAQKDQFLRDKVMRLTGIDIDRVFKPPTSQIKPTEPWVETHNRLLKSLEANGATSIDHHICLQNGKMQRLLLFYSARWDKCFFVRVDILNGTLIKSIRYGSRQRAYQVYQRNHIVWAGDLLPN